MNGSVDMAKADTTATMGSHDIESNTANSFYSERKFVGNNTNRE